MSTHDGTWRGLHEKGYVIMYANGGVAREHIVIAEKALGKRLPRGAIVHHVDENRANNDPPNLVVCPSQSYHALLHRRMRASAACGHPDWRKCNYCKQYDDPKTLKGRVTLRHAKCQADYDKHRRS